MVIESVPHTRVAVCLGKIEYFFRPFELCILIFAPYVCIVTNNRIVMEKNKNFKTNQLLIAAVEYTFTEWLRRRGILAAFKSNYSSTKQVDMSFRDALRSHIRYVFSSSYLRMGDLVSSSFIFCRTPEGCDFWRAVSSDWRHFCVDFREKF